MHRLPNIRSLEAVSAQFSLPQFSFCGTLFTGTPTHTDILLEWPMSRIPPSCIFFKSGSHIMTLTSRACFSLCNLTQCVSLQSKRVIIIRLFSAQTGHWLWAFKDSIVGISNLKLQLMPGVKITYNRGLHLSSIVETCY